MNTLNMHLRTMRKSTTAKVLLTGCSLAGFSHGFNVSRRNANHKRRLLVDRIAWASLYSGLYTVLHPIVFYEMLKQCEMRIRNNLYDTNYDYTTPWCAFLDIPHATGQTS